MPVCGYSKQLRRCFTLVCDVLQRGQEVLHDEVLVQPATHQGEEVQRVDLYVQCNAV